MVSSGEERRKKAEYSLTCIQQLASQGEVIYGSRRVQRHIENLGYSPEDVHACLGKLTSDHYRGSVRYESDPFWHDEYLITFEAKNNQPDELYIKLKLNRDCVLVILASFHPEGWI